MIGRVSWQNLVKSFFFSLRAHIFQLASAYVTQRGHLLVSASAQSLKYGSLSICGSVQQATQGSKLCFAQGAALTGLFGVKTSHSCSCAASRAESASRPWQWLSYKLLFSKENCKHVRVCQQVAHHQAMHKEASSVRYKFDMSMTSV